MSQSLYNDATYIIYKLVICVTRMFTVGFFRFVSKDFCRPT